MRHHGGGVARHCRVFVDVKQAHIQRIFTNVIGNFFDDGFDAKHTLRATKATESGGALRVGFAAVADQLEVGDVVAVVDVQTRTIVNGTRVINAVAATRHERDVGTQDTAFVVVTHFVIDAEVVTLARDHHVVVAVDAQLDGTLQFEGGQCSALTENAGIAFFAAKATAHAAANDFHVVGAKVQCGGCFTLIAVRVLRRTIQSELTVFTRHRVSNLAFHVKLFLLTRFGAALHFARRIGNGF